MLARGTMEVTQAGVAFEESAIVCSPKVKVNVAQSVGLFATPWTIHEFSRPEYWSREPFLSPGDLPNPGIQPRYPTQVSRIAGRFFAS